ncbi:hypothetical protein FACS189499_07450 [Clostridia bacterium]|nr:hypothetical protein FACS189499_07450 [Clostridia bacterium]
MLEIKIPNEIKTYEGKLILGLTARKLIFSVAALAACIPTGFALFGTLPNDMLMFTELLIAAPVIAFGWIRWNDMPFEKVIVKLWQFYAEPQKRKYRELNIFCEVRETIINEEIVRQQAEKGIK